MAPLRTRSYVPEDGKRVSQTKTMGFTSTWPAVSQGEHLLKILVSIPLVSFRYA